jgi:hypothetical protein
MKRSEFRALIREEIERVLTEQRTQRPIRRRKKRKINENTSSALEKAMGRIYALEDKGHNFDDIFNELGEFLDGETSTMFPHGLSDLLDKVQTDEELLTPVEDRILTKALNDFYKQF